LFHILYDSFIILHYITRDLTYLLYILSIIFTIPFVLSLYFNLIFYIFTYYPDFYILSSWLYDSFYGFRSYLLVVIPSYDSFYDISVFTFSIE